MPKIKTGLIALGVVLALVVLIVIFKSAPVDTVTEYQKWEAERPDMAAAVVTIFDIENLSTAYDWVITEDIADGETLIETSVFNADGTTYEFLLASVKGNVEDELYTISKYLVLTVTTPNETIVFIDLSTDGILDSVYVDDVMMNDDEVLAQAQAQYDATLLFSQTSLLASK